MSDEYAVLVAPSASRTYAADAARLAAAELRWLARGVLDDSVDAEVVTLAGVEYVALSAASAELASVVAASSSAWALFAREGALLRPVELPRRQAFPDDVVTIPKYTGKTNDQFTHLLLGLTVAASARPELLVRGRGRVLDPVCGRGTTLSTALMLGHDAVGIDVDRRDIETYAGFLATWAKTHRLPHTHRFAPLRRNKRVVAQELDFAVYADRQAQKAGDGVRVQAFVADTADAADLLKPGSVDVIVGDLPYGVHHGSHRGRDLDRRPLELVREALPAWLTVLRAGGAIGLSFNAKTLRAADLAAVLREAGLHVAEGCEEFGHRVDASIHRELLVAVRSGGAR
ncbi:SAM-dependent methyltransferase [Epidermidibacterium keratini]|uniref:SAM-dependent methyltransferase n=1 Tax=Epidermidibacterium keratini TaxID=1891644 RepID=A0A7L4YSK7_9ACTN|nr:SAM-dependent methyltransferase [Epidermidibacterium keratini]QHC01884.1 SAM-dependent methyltransferase [Epidermidibacterium keratini]